MSAQAITTSGLPGAELAPEAVETAAADLLTQATAVRDQGSDVTSTWQGLGAYYKAPESETLVAVMDPVATATDTFAGDLERVSAALSTYAADIREIKGASDALRSDINTFRYSIYRDDEWQFDQDNVDANDALRTRAADLQIRLFEAERTCANSIRAIDSIAPWHAITGDDDPNGYGYSEIPEDAEMPWGSQVQREDHCPKSAAVGVKSFVWDGVVMDIGWEGLKGLGGMIGLGEDGFSWKTFEATWGGMGALIGRDPETGEWSAGTAGTAWTETGKSLVAWDMWAQDPARAAGTLVGNVLLTVGTYGAGGAVKGVATAGRSRQVLSGVAKTASIANKILDPTDLLIGGAKALKGFKLDDVLGGLKTNITELGSKLSTSLRGIDLDVDIDLPRGRVIDDNPAVTRGGDDARATNNVNRDVDVSNEHPRTEQTNNTNHAETPAHQPADLVREHELVGAGTNGPPTTHGSGAHLIDNGSGGVGEHGSGGSGSGSGGTGPGGDGSGGNGAGGDGAPGDGNGNGGDGTGGDGSAGGNRTPDTPLGNKAATQEHFDHTLAQALHRNDLTEARFVELLDTPVSSLSLDELRSLRDIRDSLPGVTADTVLQKIIRPDLTRAFFNDLEGQIDLTTPEGVAQKAAFDRLVAEHPDIMNTAPTPYGATEVGGFVSRSIDVGDLNTRGIFDGTGLGYDDTPFGDGNKQYVAKDYFAIQFEAGHVRPSTAHYVADAIEANYTELSSLAPDAYSARLKELVEAQHTAENPKPTNPDDLNSWNDALAERHLHVDYALDPTNLHRGNGFGGGHGSYTPELQMLNRSPVPAGAEMWKITPDGTRVLVARMGASGRWEIVV